MSRLGPSSVISAIYVCCLGASRIGVFRHSMRETIPHSMLRSIASRWASCRTSSSLDPRGSETDFALTRGHKDSSLQSSVGCLLQIQESTSICPRMESWQANRALGAPLRWSPRSRVSAKLDLDNLLLI